MLQEATMAIIVQTLIEHNVEDMVVGKDEDRNPVENRALVCRICEIIADALDFPLFHTKEVRYKRIYICVQNLTITPSFQRLIEMNIIVT